MNKNTYVIPIEGGTNGTKVLCQLPSLQNAKNMKFFPLTSRVAQKSGTKVLCHSSQRPKLFFYFFLDPDQISYVIPIRVGQMGQNFYYPYLKGGGSNGSKWLEILTQLPSLQNAKNRNFPSLTSRVVGQMGQKVRFSPTPTRDQNFFFIFFRFIPKFLSAICNSYQGDQTCHTNFTNRDN